MLPLLVLSFLTPFIISLLVTPLVRNYLISRSLVEDPVKKQNLTHNATALTSVPRGGGIPVYLGIVTSIFLFLPHDQHFWGIFLGLTLTMIIGFIDDLYDISPKLRLATNVLAALIVVGSGIGIGYISSPLGGSIDISFWRYNFELFGPHSIWVIPDLLALFWIVWCMNITGWSGGVEGQLPGFVGISALFISFLGLRFSQDISEWPVIILGLAVSGAYFGFLPYNFYPQSIMTGYGAKSIAGFSLAVLSILSGAKFATLFLLLAIPMLDAGFVLLRRFRLRRSLIKSDGEHLHHLLLKSGWSRPKIALFYWLVSLVLGVVSLFTTTVEKILLIILVALVFLFVSIKIYRRI